MHFLVISSWVNAMEIFLLKQYALVIKNKKKPIEVKLVILQSIGIIIIKVRKDGLVTYTCRCSSGYPYVQSCQDELGIKFPLQ